MTIQLQELDGDDERFVDAVQTLTNRLVVAYRPSVIRVIRIDNWFGKKWCGFAGKLLGAVGVSGGRLRIPPFVPSRVDSQDYWRRSGANYQLMEGYPLHIRVSSEGNLRRYFDLYCHETIAVWYSSKSRSNGRGSIMVYSTVETTTTCSWYVELSARNFWKPTVASGITAAEFEALASNDANGAEHDEASPAIS